MSCPCEVLILAFFLVAVENGLQPNCLLRLKQLHLLLKAPIEGNKQIILVTVVQGLKTSEVLLYSNFNINAILERVSVYLVHTSMDGDILIEPNKHIDLTF